MSTVFQIVDIHSEHITVEELQDELRVNPMRLEEKENEYGNTPLLSSAEYENVAVFEFLLSLGANLEAKNKV